MPKIAPTRPRASDKQRTFIIVAIQFNEPYVEGLVDHVTKELRALAPNANVSIERVPGAFEIPVVVRELALQEKANAVIACGVILKGKTDHAQNLSRSVTDALQRIAIRHGVPEINAALRFDNETQARESCLENKVNRATDT